MSFSENHPELVELLTSISQFGFTNLQARAYISLVSLGESTGSSIAENSGINRSKIYDTLKDLERMGAVRRVSREKKTKYIAVPPEKVFNSILQNFSSKIAEGQEKLKELSEFMQSVDETRVTYSSIEVRELDVNDFEYLITGNKQTLGKLINSLSPRNRPNNEVVILQLSIEDDIVVLFSRERILIFQPPIGKIIENLLSIESPEISRVFYNILLSSWKMPDSQIIEMVETTGIRLLYSGVAIYVDQPMETSGHYEYQRPVFFIVTDAHIVFYYEGEEDHKVPVLSISRVDLLSSNTLECTLSAKTGTYLGKLRMRIIGTALMLKGILEVVSPQIR